MTKTPSTPIKAYRNIPFLTSPAARALRILAEYEEPLDRFQRNGIRDTIIVFGSARSKSREEAEAALAALDAEGPGNDPKGFAARRRRAEIAKDLSGYYEHARELSKRLTEWSTARADGPEYVIATGAGPGMMEAANRGAAEVEGGRSVGLGISLPLLLEPPNPFIEPELNLQFHYFFMRKFWFTYMAKAAVVMPGGFGTMDELFETLTLIQTRKVDRPLPIILVGKDFWTEIINFPAFARWGLIKEEDLDLFTIVDTVDEAFETVTGALNKIERQEA